MPSSEGPLYWAGLSSSGRPHPASLHLPGLCPGKGVGDLVCTAVQWVMKDYLGAHSPQAQVFQEALIPYKQVQALGFACIERMGKRNFLALLINPAVKALLMGNSLQKELPPSRHCAPSPRLKLLQAGAVLTLLNFQHSRVTQQIEAECLKSLRDAQGSIQAFHLPSPHSAPS